MQARHQKRAVLHTLCVLAFAAFGCDACDDVASYQVEGDHPYVRCAARDPLEEREWKVGGLGFQIEERVLRVSLEATDVRVGAFAGPGPFPESIDSALAEAKEVEPNLWMVLGGIGDDLKTAKRTLVSLADSGIPALVLAGGRDDMRVWDDAFEALSEEAHDRVIDVTALRRIEVADQELIVVAGAPLGRYARTDTACGHGAEDLEEIRDDVGGTSGARLLLSWAAPLGAPGLGLEGQDAGDPALAEFGRAVGASGGIHGWPPGAAGIPRPEPDLSLVVLPAAGSWVPRFDGSREPPGVMLLSLGQAGLRLAGG